MNKSSFILPVAYHPGDTLNEKLQEMKMSVKEFAIRTNKPEKTIYAVISGKSSVTPDMAVAFENITRIPANFWLNKQRGYDEYIARLKQEEQLVQAISWANMFPYVQMVKYGWVRACQTAQDRVRELLAFFRISSVEAWENYYFNVQSATLFRISLRTAKEPYAISAWLCRGDQQMAELSVPAYSAKMLKEVIPAMKQVMIDQPDDFFTQLQTLCAKAGVKLVYTPCLAKAPISGSTRWYHDTPCIQMSGRYKRYDTFWFTFFHEIGHILLHGKKDIFLENIEMEDIEMEKEQQADAFASNILLPKEQEEAIISAGNFSDRAIQQLALHYATHPAIIVGRLHYRNVLPYNRGTRLNCSIDLA